MYHLTSSVGLNTTAATPSEAAGILARHFSDHTPDGPIQWAVTTPGGEQDCSGRITIPTETAAGAERFIHETVADITAYLTKHADTQAR